jgi:membrane protein
MRSSTDPIRTLATIADRDGNPAQLRGPGRARYVVRARRRFAEDGCGTLAAMLAGYCFLSLLSAAIAVLGLAGLLRPSADAVHRFVDGATRAFPPGVAAALSQAVSSAGSQSYRSSMVALIAGLAVALCSALGAMTVLQTGLGQVYEVAGHRKLVVRWFHAVPLLPCTLVLGGAASALLVFGQPVGAEIEGHVGLAGTAFVAIWTAMRWVVAAALFSILLDYYYSFRPSSPLTQWRWVSTLTGTAIFLTASLLFSFYIARFGAHGRVYGSLVSVVILAVWLYVLSVAVLIGAELDAQASGQRLAAADQPESPASKLQEQAAQPQPARASAPAQRQAPDLNGWQPEPLTATAGPQALRTTVGVAASPDGGLAQLPRRVPGESLRNKGRRPLDAGPT